MGLSRSKEVKNEKIKDEYGKREGALILVSCLNLNGRYNRLGVAKIGVDPLFLAATEMSTMLNFFHLRFSGGRGIHFSIDSECFYKETAQNKIRAFFQNPLYNCHIIYYTGHGYCKQDQSNNNPLLEHKKSVGNPQEKSEESEKSDEEQNAEEEKDTRRGDWIFTPKENESEENWTLSLSEIRQMWDELKPDSMLLIISDCCYSGTWVHKNRKENLKEPRPIYVFATSYSKEKATSLAFTESYYINDMAYWSDFGKAMVSVYKLARNRRKALPKVVSDIKDFRLSKDFKEEDASFYLTKKYVFMRLYSIYRTRRSLFIFSYEDIQE